MCTWCTTTQSWSNSLPLTIQTIATAQTLSPDGPITTATHVELNDSSDINVIATVNRKFHQSDARKNPQRHGIQVGLSDTFHANTSWTAHVRCESVKWQKCNLMKRETCPMSSLNMTFSHGRRLRLSVDSRQWTIDSTAYKSTDTTSTRLKLTVGSNEIYLLET